MIKNNFDTALLSFIIFLLINKADNELPENKRKKALQKRRATVHIL